MGCPAHGRRGSDGAARRGDRLAPGVHGDEPAAAAADLPRGGTATAVAGTNGPLRATREALRSPAMSEPSRLCLVLERVPEEVHEPDLVTTLPLVSFDAFAPGHRVFGWVRLDADRLTDMLNAHLELLLDNVLVEALNAGTTIAADQAVVRRSELIAVRASGPQGDAQLRAETVGHPALVESAPYRIGGHLQGTPRADPMLRIHGPDAMIPLTEAWIAYRSGGEERTRRVGTIIVNRDLATRFEIVSAETLASATREIRTAA